MKKTILTAAGIRMLIFGMLGFSCGMTYSQNVAINITGTAGASTNMFEVTQTSAAANMVAIYAIHSGASAGTGYGLYSLKSGAATTNIAGYFEATGGTNNYPGIFMGGNVGIGTTTPSAKLEVNGTMRVIGPNGRLLFDIGAMDAAQSGIAMGYGTTYNGTAMTNYGFIQAETQGSAYKGLLLNPLGGNVGIRTTAPGATLHVDGGASAFFRNSSVNSSGVEIRGGMDGGNSSSIYLKNPAGTLSTVLSDGTYNSYLNLTGGNVGIGTATPIAHLEVVDAISGANSLTVSKNFNGIGNTNTAFIGGTDAAYSNTGIYVNQKDNLGFPSATSYIFNVVNNASSAFVVNGLNSVGIGTLSPAEKLTVRIAADLNLGVTSIGGITTLLAHNDAWSAWADLAFQANNLVVKGSGGTFGYVGIQTTAPGYPLTVNGQPAANGYTAFTNYSDARLKKNIAELDGCLEKILKLRPVQFSYNEEYLRLYNDPSMLAKPQKGFIAQEVQVLFPEMVGSVTIEGREYLDLNLSNLQVYMVRAMQEQQKTIEELKTENALLKASTQERISKLEAEVHLLMQTLQQEAKR